MSFWKKVAKWLGPIGRTIVSAVVAAVVFVGVTIASGGNVHLAAASAAGAFSFTNTFLNASAQGASFGRALAAGAVNGAAAFGAVYLGWGAGPVGGALIGAYFGAAGGAASSAILGGNPGTGALSGAVGGAIMGGAGGAFGVPGALAAAAGAGAASAAVSGGNIGQGAYLGAIGAITFAIASASFQAAIDAGRARAAAKGAAPAEANASVTNAVNENQATGGLSLLALRQRGVDSNGSALTVNVANPLGSGIINNALISGGLGLALAGARLGSAPLMVAGGIIAAVGLARKFGGLASIPEKASTAAEGIYEGTGLREHMQEIDRAGSGNL